MLAPSLEGTRPQIACPVSSNAFSAPLPGPRRPAFPLAARQSTYPLSFEADPHTLQLAAKASRGLALIFSCFSHLRTIPSAPDYLLCFDTLPHSFVFPKTLSPAFSIVSALFPQNTPGGVPPSLFAVDSPRLS